MKKVLVVVDMQNDFIDGVLGTEEARAVVPNVVDKIEHWDGEIVCTRDAHDENYLLTREGRFLPTPHCIQGTWGCRLNPSVLSALMHKDSAANILKKHTFGSVALSDIVRDISPDYVEFVGVCTDICVVSNALLVKANCPEIDIAVDSKCCAGVTPETHEAALTTMKMCQIEVK